MPRTISRRVTITQDMPAALEDLKLPPGVTLDKFLDAEKQRISAKYPVVKEGVTEVDPELKEMMRIADREQKYWEEKRQLVRLRIREQMGFAKKAAADGEVFAERRMFPVDEKITDSYDVDAIYAVSS
jgi:hypothetical protein